ncbi:hypothetical protein DSO57_1000579, partial [Entomophthora muscae]
MVLTTGAVNPLIIPFASMFSGPLPPPIQEPSSPEIASPPVVIHMGAVLQARVDLASNKENMLKSDNVWLAGDA